MSGGRHARAREPRSGSVSLFAVTVVTAGVAATAAFVDDIRLVRAAVVLLAVLVVVPFAVVVARSRDTERSLQALLAERSADVRQRNEEMHELRRELVLAHEVNAELAMELNRLREQLDGLVLPVVIEPEPVYPSLHLPLVRAAFAEDLPPVVTFEPARQPAEVPPAVTVDTGSDPMSGRRVLDLTASEIHQLRRASGS